MGSMKISFNDNKRAYLPGETLRGTASWSLEKPAGQVKIHLIWRTEGKGTQDSGLIESIAYDNLDRNGEREFQFKLPGQPYSYSGTLISILWEAELEAEGADDISHEAIIVSPFGRPVTAQPEKP